MTLEEKKQKQYAKALRYIANAKELLAKAGEIKNSRYQDGKYVRSACGTAYKSVLLAMDVLAEEKGIPIPQKPQKDLYFYQRVVRDNEKRKNAFQDAYNFLYLSGCCDKSTNTCIVKTGFSAAKILIDIIKPSSHGATAALPVIASRRRGNPPAPSLRAAGVAIHPLRHCEPQAWQSARSVIASRRRGNPQKLTLE